MSTVYRISYKIIEGSHIYSGTRIIEVTLDRYMEHVHKNYSEASYVYLELIEELEDDTPDEADSMIILPYAYDSLLP